MSSLVPIFEKGKTVQNKQSIDKEASSDNHKFTGDEGSSSKCMKKCPITYRISDLPDGVLQTILSYLPAPEVVRTSILSSQWRELWTAVPCLQADDKRRFEGGEVNIMNFVTCMLENRSDKAPLKVFDIDSEHSQGLEYWISYAVTHNVESLQLYDGVTMGGHLELGTSINFSSSHLQILAFCSISLTATQMSQLDEHCPNLRILMLEVAYLDTVQISSSSLTKLYMEDCHTPGDLVISAPNLTLLSCNNLGITNVTLEKLPLLVEASVGLHFSVDDPYDEDWAMEHYKYNMLRGLSHVQTLELNVPIREPQASWRELHWAQMFRNLASLILDEWCMADLYPVAWFIHQAPLLENLWVMLRTVKPAVEYEPRNYPMGTPLRALCLNTVTIFSITTDPMLQELMKLLRSAGKASLEIKIEEPYYY